MFHGSRLSSSSTRMLFGTDGVVGVPTSVSPFGMGVPEAAHPERQQRFKVDALLGAVMAHEAQRRTLRSSKARSPAHVGDGSGEMFDPGVRWRRHPRSGRARR